MHLRKWYGSSWRCHAAVRLECGAERSIVLGVLHVIAQGRMLISHAAVSCSIHGTAVLRKAAVQASGSNQIECQLANANRELICRPRPAPDAAKQPSPRTHNARCEDRACATAIGMVHPTLFERCNCVAWRQAAAQ